MESLRRKQSSSCSSFDSDSDITRGIEFSHGNIPGTCSAFIVLVLFSIPTKYQS